ncbi:hypothetical protein [Aneurinibacillus aneurinilyticus]|uniref:hypothetical protein n=1 Tax=Aneurinibacillus aneurinilyticus TaxID=1391 RepID=UPI0035261D9E
MKRFLMAVIDSGKTIGIALCGAIFIGLASYWWIYMKDEEKVVVQASGSQVEAHMAVQKKEMTAWHNEVLAKMFKREAPADSLGPFVQQSLPILLPESYKTYRVVSMDNPVVQQLPRDMYVLETDVVLEKGGLYDWRRYKTVIQKHKIVSLRLGSIDYLTRVKDDARNIEAEKVVKEAIQGVGGEDRSHYGVYLRGTNKGQKGTTVKVQDIQFIAGSMHEQLYQVKYTINTFGKVKIQEAVVFARMYEDRKWQIEDIAALGETI